MGRVYSSLKTLPGGWRTAAIWNIIGISVLLLLLIGFLIAAVIGTNDIRQTFLLYTGDCKSGGATRTNFALHLLLNVLSTAILASSNFFMQVLNAPTRKEVDLVHAKGHWVDIGIPSLRNIFRVSRFKSVAWTILFLSSVPIHLLFNSAIFEIDRREGDFHLTIATESFLNGGAYYLPGASLFSGAHLIGYSEEGVQYGDDDDDKPPTLDEYRGYESPAAQNVSKAASDASKWTRLDARSCLAEYVACSGLRDYQDVVMVVDRPDWVRADTWNLTEDADAFWTGKIPNSAGNSLWSSSQCRMFARIKSRGLPGCSTNCDMVTYNTESTDASFTVRFFSNSFPGEVVTWNTPQWPPWTNYPAPAADYSVQNYSEYAYQVGLRPQEEYLNISHCIAQPREAVMCHVGLSIPFLLAVLLAGLVKLITCIVVVIIIGPQESLVTPGDAIASFISIPDPVSSQIGIVNQSVLSEAARNGNSKLVDLEQFYFQRERRASTVPRSIWYASYAILILGTIAVGACLLAELASGGQLKFINIGGTEPDSFMLAPVPHSSFISQVIFANSLQLFFALWYLVYNSLLTRLESCQEWAMFSTSYRALRVTKPQGQQRETYRLQLPYRYSIPLIIMSIVVHWLLSICLHIVVTQGSYYVADQGYEGSYTADPISLPQGSVIAWGTSSGALLFLFILGVILVPIPWIIGRRILPGIIPNVGANSLALSAACQVKPHRRIPSVIHTMDEVDKVQSIHELQKMQPEAATKFSEDETQLLTYDKEPDLVRVSQSLLKWGLVKIPTTRYEDSEEPVKYLSFGTLADNVEIPVEDDSYIRASPSDGLLEYRSL
ncbi:hypothetical protein F5B20DRAFT_426034 [Whalleya microplaca]|nr:hypothetical protein F5B20DRAFT_426034 [Whalleya microplaca]